MNTITRLGLLVVLCTSLGTTQIAAFDMGLAVMGAGIAGMGRILYKSCKNEINNCYQCKQLKNKSLKERCDHLIESHDADLSVLFGTAIFGISLLAVSPLYLEFTEQSYNLEALGRSIASLIIVLPNAAFLGGLSAMSAVNAFNNEAVYRRKINMIFNGTFATVCAGIALAAGYVGIKNMQQIRQ